MTLQLKLLTKIKNKVKEISGFKEETSNLALALSFGIAIGLSPLYGLHTLLSFVGGFVFKLNKVAVFGAPWIVNPFTFIPIYGSGTAFGAWFLGYHKTHLKNIDFGDSFYTLKEMGLPLFKSFLLGNMIFAVLGGFLSYWFFLFIISKLRKETVIRNKNK